MKPYFDFSSEVNFWLLLACLFLPPISIAATYAAFILLLPPFVATLVRRRPFPVWPRFFWFFVAYAVFSILSSFFSTAVLDSLKDNRELFILLMIPFCLVSLTTIRRLRLALATVLFSQLVSAVFGIVQWARVGISLDHRLKGFTSHWMTFSGLLMQALVFFGIVWLLNRAARKKAWLLPALLLMLLVLALSLTRSAWIGLAASIFLFLAFQWPRRMFAIVPVALLILVMIFFLAPKPVQQRLASIVDPNEASNRDRLHMLYTGWHMFLDHPVTGVGPNQVSAQYPAYRHPRSDKDNPHLHNNFLQVLAERGILALAAFLAAWIFFFVDGTANLRRQAGGRRQVSKAALFTGVAFLFAGLFEYNFGDSEVRFLILFFLTLPFLSLDEDDHDDTQTSGRTPFPIP